MSAPVLKSVSKDEAKRLWLHAQKLDERNPFGRGPQATAAAIEHLGYVQIDTINVIERSHHHILFTRIPQYRREDLRRAQSVDKSVFEYWTHALAYVPTRDYRFFAPDMRASKKNPSKWFQKVSKQDLAKVMRRIRKEGPISIRDITDDELVEKDHDWASRKPSKRALQRAFYMGDLTICERVGMLKKYDLTDRHFGWDKKPKGATAREITNYLLDRSLRAQSLVSLDSICHLNASAKPVIKALIERRVRAGELVPIQIEGADAPLHWIKPEDLDQKLEPIEDMVHLLSPFDPLTIQRQRLRSFFDYDHRFEAYIPKEKRLYGYFALPVLVNDQIVAVLDLKTDRENEKLLMQKWTWTAKKRPRELKAQIEEELGRFEKFQLAK